MAMRFFLKNLNMLAVMAGLLFVPNLAKAQITADKVSNTFTVSDGLEFKLWASEPLFANPTTMDIDEKGRVWVCEAVNYRRKLRNQPPLRAEGDRLVILEDSNGDGVADKAITFFQSPAVMAPLGIAIAKDAKGPGRKIYYCQSPDIMVLEDKDGDDKADGPPKVLLTGFQGIDHDHGVHGISIGPDGKLYFSVGDAGVKDLKSADGKGKSWTSNSTDLRAGTVWKCDLDGNNLELIAHNFRNNYMPAIDSFGTVFISDNDDDGNQMTRICYVMPGGNFGYHPRGPGQTHWHEEQPGVVPKILRTYFGSPTGMCMYEANLLPAKYRGQSFHTDAGPRHVRCYHSKVNGAGFEVEPENVVTSTDNWFRPSDVKVAPDGSIFVSDWYDPGVGGHGMGDTTRGRVFRLAPKGSNTISVSVNLDKPEGVLAALSSGNNAIRFMGIQKISSMNVEDVKALVKIALAQKDIAEMPWILARLNWFLPDSVALPEKLKNREEFQWQAVRKIAARHPGFEGVSPAAEKLLGELVQSGTAGTRREILLELRKNVSDSAKRNFYALAKKYDGKDLFYLKAIEVACADDGQHRSAFLADFSREFPKWNSQVADLVFELRPDDMVAKIPSMLADKALSSEQKARLVSILAASDNPAQGNDLIKMLHASDDSSVQEGILEALKLFLPGKWSSLNKSPELKSAIKSLLSGNDREQLMGLGLVEASKQKEYLVSVVGLAQKASNEKIRQQAIKTLGSVPEKECVQYLVELWNSKESQREEIAKALANLSAGKGRQPGVPGALEALQNFFQGAKADKQSLSFLIQTMAGTRGGTEFLLKQAEVSQNAEWKEEIGRVVRNSPFQDLRNRAMVALPAPAKLDLKKLPSSQVLAQRNGNVEQGRALFYASVNSQLQCLKCHKVLDKGGAIGPDLTQIGKKASKENLYDSLLHPSKAIADQFLTWVVETSKGQVLTGLVVEENKDSLTLRDGNGKDYKIDKKDIDSKSRGQNSLMPADLVLNLTETELADLVEYLFALK